MAMPYFPAYSGYPYQMPMYQNQYSAPATPQQNGFLAAWIQGGEQSMKSYNLTGANQRIYLFSTEENVFGVKSTDASGMPLPLEMFRYERINAGKPQNAPTAASIDTSGFITREEFEARIAQICGSQAHIEKEGANDGK